MNFFFYLAKLYTAILTLPSIISHYVYLMPANICNGRPSVVPDFQMIPIHTSVLTGNFSILLIYLAVQQINSIWMFSSFAGFLKCHSSQPSENIPLSVIFTLSQKDTAYQLSWAQSWVFLRNTLL